MKSIIIVNSMSIFDNSATGITLRSIIDASNKYRYVEVFWGNNNERKSKKIDGYLLNSYLPLVQSLLQKLRKSKINSVTKKQEVSSSIHAPNTKHSLTTIVRQYGAALLDIIPIKLNKYVIKKLADDNPCAVYTLGGSLNSLRVSLLISRLFDIPIIIHHMDNWLHYTQWESNPLLCSYIHKLRKYCYKCYSRSIECLAISPQMADVYTSETGVKHTALMNTIKVDSYVQKPSMPISLNEPIRFIYAGGLHLGRNIALIEFATVLKKLENSSSIKFCFDIYTSDSNKVTYEPQFSDFGFIRFKTQVPHDEIKNVYSKADVLVHIESNELAGNEFFRYSISTKIPEYLATGKTVLFYGPKDIYLYEFLKRNELAYVADNMDSLEQTIVEITKLAKKVGCNNFRGITYAKEHFDVCVSVDTFESVIDSSVNKWISRKH